MSRPRLTGVRSDGRGYVVTAAKAIQDITHPAAVELREIEGDIPMTDDKRLHVTAASGLYDSVRQSLELSQNVHLRSPSYDVTVSDANIDFKSGLYSSDQPVLVVSADGATIHADSVAVRDSGAEFTFVGHVRSIFNSAASGAPTLDDLKGPAQ